MLRVAVIGAGVMGTLHARIFSQIKNVHLLGICDINPQKGKKLAKLYNTKYFQDIDKLLTDSKLDGVTIAVPTIFHKQIALGCIKKGIHILVEKPLAETVKDASIIAKSAKQKGVILTVGHIERFNPVIIKLKELIRDKVFGSVVSIAIKRVGLYPPRIQDVNVVTDLAVHDLDIICNLLGKSPSSIYATGGKGLNRNQLDYADIFLDFGGMSGYIQVNWITPIKIRNLSVTGTSGYCELNYVTQELILYKSNFDKILPQQFEKFVRKLEPKKIAVKIKKDEPLKLELMNFLNSIKKGHQPQVSPEEGLLTVKLSELVIKSIEEKRIIKL